MKKIILYNPALSTKNIGDEIIVESCKLELKEVLQNKFVIDISTHMPLNREYLKRIDNVSLRIVLGSNLLLPDMKGKDDQWNIKLADVDVAGPVITMGVGWSKYEKEINEYTKRIYTKIFNKKYLHSVRDSYTEERLRSIGINNVINTGCVTLWKLTESHCKQIPEHKSKDVVCTLTDYSRAEKEDLELLNILKENYENIYFWVQGSKDYEYITSLNFKGNIKFIGPSLSEYNELLKSNENIDFVGTRLHGGIKALQNKKRTIIIGIDNRAIEMQKDFNIPVIKRENINELSNMINSKFSTDIKINEDNIKIWKEQFKES